MMVVVVFFATPLAQARRAHIRVEVVYGLMPKPLQFSADVLQFLLNTVFYAFIAYFGWKAGMRSFEQGEIAPGIINFPIWPARFALFLGAFCDGPSSAPPISLTFSRDAEPPARRATNRLRRSDRCRIP